jgi:hypothetical protein
LKEKKILPNWPTANRWEDTNGFPKRIQLGPHSVAWKADEVDAWVKNRKPARHGTFAGTSATQAQSAFATAE